MRVLLLAKIRTLSTVLTKIWLSIMLAVGACEPKRDFGKGMLQDALYESGLVTAAWTKYFLIDQKKFSFPKLTSSSLKRFSKATL